MTKNNEEPYISPLLKRIKDNEVLSLETLAKYVPIAQAGWAAEEAIKTTTQKTEQTELLRTIAKGENAKEKLVLIAMPLIKMLAYKEFQRRKAWNSRVPLEDIISEGLGGFIRGIKAYNPEGTHTSPTNYLGQWILTDMRRNTENLEHDFSIPYEAIERQRKIRAIRSRLTSKLNRDPTDEEILEAAQDYSYSESMMGKVNKPTTQTPSTRRILTQKHLDEERSLYSRTGAMLSNQIFTEGKEYTLAEEAKAKTITDAGEPQYGDITILEENSAHETMQKLLEDAFNILNIYEIQRDIIRRRFGLPPYPQEQTVKDITIYTGIPKHKINRIITAFTLEMTTKNGKFHELIWNHRADEIHAMNMGWLLPILGTFQGPAKTNTDKDLTTPIKKSRKNTKTNNPDNTTETITYYCQQENKNYTYTTTNETNEPPTILCPECHTNIPKIHTI